MAAAMTDKLNSAHKQVTAATIGALLSCAAAAVGNASTGEAPAKRINVARADSVPIIDGLLDDNLWRTTEPFRDLHQVIPTEYSRPSAVTDWYIRYDDTTLYVAARAFDSMPEAIIARTLRQGGSLDSDDTLRILIDAFNDKRSGYMFALNPNGVRYDAIYTNGTRENDEWDGIWRAAAHRTTEGWSMEMAIPFNTIKFNPDNDTWGLNFWREIPRHNELIAWSSRNGVVNPTVSGEGVGFSNISQGLGLDLIPSLSTRLVLDRRSDTSTGDVLPALDISYKIGNSINALLTINTDFSATEVDERQLDLQRFSLFFPEKRSFFLTDFDIFQFGGIPTGSGSTPVGTLSRNNALAFFSRRIGLSATREPVDIVAGAKTSGRLVGLDFGMLYIRQDEFAGLDAQDLAVARVARSVFSESTLGAIYTNGDPTSESDNSLVGLDFLYRNTRLPGNRTFESQFWAQKSDSEGLSGKDSAYNLSIAFPSRLGIQTGAQYHVVEENFYPALGFANRVGVRFFAAQLGYWHDFDDPNYFRDVGAGTVFERWEYLDTGRVQSEMLDLTPLRVRSVAGDAGRLYVKFHKEGLLAEEQPLSRIGILLPQGEYDFHRYGVFYSMSGHRRLSGQIRVETGNYYDGRMIQYNPKVDWRPNKHFGLGLAFDYKSFDLPGGSAITRQLSLDSEIAFNSKWALLGLAQYDNVSDNIGINARIRYNVEAGRDIWFVLDHNMVLDPLDDRFVSTRSAAVFKFRYTFRY